MRVHEPRQKDLIDYRSVWHLSRRKGDMIWPCVCPVVVPCFSMSVMSAVHFNSVRRVVQIVKHNVKISDWEIDVDHLNGESGEGRSHDFMK